MQVSKSNNLTNLQKKWGIYKMVPLIAGIYAARRFRESILIYGGSSMNANGILREAKASLNEKNRAKKPSSKQRVNGSSTSSGITGSRKPVSNDMQRKANIRPPKPVSNDMQRKANIRPPKPVDVAKAMRQASKPAVSNNAAQRRKTGDSEIVVTQTIPKKKLEDDAGLAKLTKDKVDAFFGNFAEGPWHKWKKGFGKETEDAFNNYSKENKPGDSDDVNTLLRLGKMSSKHTGELDIIDEMDFDFLKYFHQASLMEKAINEYELGADLIVYRAADNYIVGQTSEPDEIKKRFIDKQLPVSDKGFMSTSAVKGSNHQFVKDNTISYIIKVPKGKGRGAYISPMSDYSAEDEFLLQHGSSFLVKNAYKVDDVWDNKPIQRTVVELELIVNDNMPQSQPAYDAGIYETVGDGNGVMQQDGVQPTKEQTLIKPPAIKASSLMKKPVVKAGSLMQKPVAKVQTLQKPPMVQTDTLMKKNVIGSMKQIFEQSKSQPPKAQPTAAISKDKQNALKQIFEQPKNQLPIAQPKQVQPKFGNSNVDFSALKQIFDPKKSINTKPKPSQSYVPQGPRAYEMTQLSLMNNKFNPGNIPEIKKVQDEIDKQNNPFDAYKVFIRFAGNEDGQLIPQGPWNINNVDMNLFRAKLKNMCRMVYDYPELKGRIGNLTEINNFDPKNMGITMSAKGSAGNDKAELFYNGFVDRQGPDGDLERYNEEWKRLMSGYMGHNAASADYTGNHELGHVLNSMLYKYMSKNDAVYDWNHMITSNNMMKEVLKKVLNPLQFAQLQSHYTNGGDHVIGQINPSASGLNYLYNVTSSYGQTSSNEFFAEAFADVYAHGVNARPASIEFVKLYEKMRDEMERNNVGRAPWSGI